MILIKKNNPPKEFTRFTIQNPDAHFDDMPANVKDALRKSLLEEQGYLCAYCMARINKNVKIEHYVPRNDTNELDYDNLLAVCMGNEGRPRKEQHCDTHKGDSELNIDPQNSVHIQQIGYKPDGTIHASGNQAFEKDLNDILNLNYRYGYIKTNRKAALDKIKADIHKKLGDKSALQSYLKKMLEFYATLHNGEFREYSGIITDYLRKRIKRLMT